MTSAGYIILHVMAVSLIAPKALPDATSGPRGYSELELRAFFDYIFLMTLPEEALMNEKVKAWRRYMFDYEVQIWNSTD